MAESHLSWQGPCCSYWACVGILVGPSERCSVSNLCTCSLWEKPFRPVSSCQISVPGSVSHPHTQVCFHRIVSIHYSYIKQSDRTSLGWTAQTKYQLFFSLERCDRPVLMCWLCCPCWPALACIAPCCGAPGGAWCWT